MIKTTKNSRKLLVSFLVFALIIASFSNMKNVKAAVTASGVIYDGNGEVTKTLLNGKNAKVILNGSVLNITVDGEKYPYYSKPSIGTCVIADDDLLQFFWDGGIYEIYDLYEPGRFIRAGYSKVSGENVTYYQVTDSTDSHIVKGTSAPNIFHSCIVDKKYFYMSGQTGKKRLMTREQFEEIMNGGKEDPTPTPTATPTVTPTPTPEVTPTATPSCDCKNGGTCNCPDGKCTCDNCPCKDKPCKPTATPTTTPNGGCKGNCGCGCGSDCNGNCCNGNCKCLNGGNNNNAGNGGIAGDNVNNSGIDVSGNGNTISVNQNIINNTINGNNNSIGTGVNAPVPVTKKATTTTKAKTTKKVKAKTYYAAIKSGNRMKLYKVTQKVVNGKIKTTRKWLSICLFDRKKGRMDWNSYRIKGVKKAQYSAKKHYIVIITKGGVVKACPSGKGTKKVKRIGKGAVAFKCNSRGLAYAYVKKNGKVVKLAY